MSLEPSSEGSCVVWGYDDSSSPLRRETNTNSPPLSPLFQTGTTTAAAITNASQERGNKKISSLPLSVSHTKKLTKVMTTASIKTNRSIGRPWRGIEEYVIFRRRRQIRVFSYHLRFFLFLFALAKNNTATVVWIHPLLILKTGRGKRKCTDFFPKFISPTLGLYLPPNIAPINSPVN